MMSKDKAKPAADAAEAAPKKGKGKLLIIIVAAVLLLAGGGGAAWFVLHKKSAGHEETQAKHEEPAKPPVFARLESFTVNLSADGEEHYLQTDIELQVHDAKDVDKIKAHMPEVRNNILLLLSSKTAGALASVEGKEKLSSEIREQINKALHAKEGEGVSGVFFTSFVIQ